MADAVFFSGFICRAAVKQEIAKSCCLPFSAELACFTKLATLGSIAILCPPVDTVAPLATTLITVDISDADPISRTRRLIFIRSIAHLWFVARKDKPANR